MTEIDRPSAYDFESQLELGELLLGLGRVEEAELELRKARELNQAGSYRTADNDPMRQAHLDRLAAALERVQHIRGKNSRNSRLMWLLATGLLTTMLAVVFTSWMLNRAELKKSNEGAVATSEAIATRNAEIDQKEKDISAERTRYVEDIIVRNRVATEAAQVALMGQLAATQAAEARATMVSQELVDNQSAQQTAFPEQGGSADNPDQLSETETPESDAIASADTGVNPTPTTVEEVTPTPRPDYEVGGFTQLRVTSGAANLRTGPGFGFLVIETLPSQEVMVLEGQSPDSFWYFVSRENGQQGWIHSSTAKPVALDSLPIFTGPVAPVEPTAVPPTPIPPTAVPVFVQPTNTNVPTRIPATTAPTRIPPTNTPQPPPATNTPIPPATNTPVPPPPATAVPTVSNNNNPQAQPTVMPVFPTAIPIVLTPEPSPVPEQAQPTAEPVTEPTEAAETEVPETENSEGDNGEAGETSEPVATEVPSAEPTDAPEQPTPEQSPDSENQPAAVETVEPTPDAPSVLSP